MFFYNKTISDVRLRRIFAKNNNMQTNKTKGNCMHHVDPLHIAHFYLIRFLIVLFGINIMYSPHKIVGRPSYGLSTQGQ